MTPAIIKYLTYKPAGSIVSTWTSVLTAAVWPVCLWWSNPCRATKEN